MENGTKTPAEKAAPLTALAGCAVVFSLAAYLYIVVNSYPSFFDDAYMFIRYANNILAGYGHAWNPGGQQTFGSTSLTHVAVVTALKACFPRMEDGRLLVLSSAIPAGLMLLVLVLSCGQLARHPLLARNWLVWAAMVLPVVVLQEVFKYHLRSGMDTMLSGLANALLILFTLRFVAAAGHRATGSFVVTAFTRSRAGPRPERPDESGHYKRLALVVIAAYFSYLTRPDNGIYATLFPALCILLLAVEGRRKWLLRFWGAMAAVLLADAGVKQWVFGTPLPLPFFAKQLGAFEGYSGVGYWNPLDLMRTFAWTAMPALCLILLCARRRTLPLLTAFLAPVALTFGYYLTINQIMGFEARFYYPALPFLVVAAAAALDDRFTESEPGGLWGRREFLARLIGMLLVIFGTRQAAYTLAPIYAKPFGAPPAAPRPLVPLKLVPGGRPHDEFVRLASQVPKGTVIALSEYGRVGAAAPQAILIDMVGLHDKHVAWEGFSADWLFQQKPDLIWFPHYFYTKMVTQILDYPAFEQDYLYYPAAFDLGLAIRKDSPHFEALSSLLKTHWKRLYGEASNPEDDLARPAGSPDHSRLSISPMRKPGQLLP